MEYNALLRKLPIGIQTFADIRQGNYLYVDKTALVWRIANTGKPYFLSRPRRLARVYFCPLLRLTSKARRNSLKDLPLRRWKRNGRNFPYYIWI